MPDDRIATTRRIERRGALLLLLATALALVVTNTGAATLYDRLLDVDLGVRVGEHELAKPLLLWINDGLMAFFFLVAGLELKRELLVGSREGWRALLLPMCAAAGGVLVPVAIYVAVNADSGMRLRGWAIPGATDIAFAVGMLALLGSRVPPALRLFLLTLAVFDDMVAIVIIAVAYTHHATEAARWLALSAIALLFVLNRLGVTRSGVYLLVGAFLWVCVLKSGIHATLAGVLVGLAIPRGARTELGHPPLDQLESTMRPWVAFVVLPLFAFVNAGVTLRGVGIETWTHPVAVGIAAGLVLGKPIGVFGATMLVAKLRIAPLPDGMRGGHLLGVALLAGIGFTMSLFLGTLAFEETPRSFDRPVRIGVLGASVAAAISGLLVLRRTLPAASEPPSPEVRVGS